MTVFKFLLEQRKQGKGKSLDSWVWGGLTGRVYFQEEGSSSREIKTHTMCGLLVSL